MQKKKKKKKKVPCDVIASVVYTVPTLGVTLQLLQLAVVSAETRYIYETYVAA